QNLAPDDEQSYLREFDHLTLARLLIARGKSEPDENYLQDAHHLLARLLSAAESGGRTGSASEILVQRALAHEVQGNRASALDTLSRALELAEPAGYVRLFLDEGKPLLTLLKTLLAEGREPKRYVAQLLAASGVGDIVSQPVVTNEQPLLEPLSERELEVLQLVAEGLSNREIAERLYLALSTVKGHNRVIYGKLHVSRRTEAVAKARELGLL
ncbi:MAG: hypothetical protein KC434_15770, partial [Anaerolineales bacterium]|nr:hypothetical protein [Anaerolineales bacterium]